MGRLGNCTACAAAVLGLLLGLLRITNPEEFPDRLAKLDLASTSIENEGPYNESSHWSPAGQLGLLYRLNEARVPYFKGQLASLSSEAGRPAVLDIGCGGGIATNALALQMPTVDFTGIDMQDAALVYAKNIAANWSLPNVKYMKGSAFELPFEDGTFDGIVCSDVLEHLLDLRTAVAEMARVLRPGGILTVDTIHRTTISRLLSVEIPENWLGLLRPNTHDWRLFITPAELQALMLTSGFHTNVSMYMEMAPNLRMVVEVLLISLGWIRIEEAKGSFVIGGYPMMSYVATAKKPLL